MRILVLVLALCLGGSALAAEDVPVGGSVTGTARVSGLGVPLNQILVTPKADYTHIIWDSFAEREAIKNAGKTFDFAAAALDLVKGPGVAAKPGCALFKVDVVEFPVRDDYGAPRWDKVVFLERYVVRRNAAGKWIVGKRPGA